MDVETSSRRERASIGCETCAEAGFGFVVMGNGMLFRSRCCDLKHHAHLGSPRNRFRTGCSRSDHHVRLFREGLVERPGGLKWQIGRFRSLPIE